MCEMRCLELREEQEDMMRIVFMGTPDFAVSALEAIIAAGYEVAAVVTQPDKPKGRGKEMQFPAVKECALNYQIPVFQPIKIKTADAVEVLREFQADLFIVAAFGQILSKEILEMPKYGCINIHASLLPKYRGAAPIQWAILDGETQTGVTIMQMDVGLDTGDMLLKTEVPISDDETGESLHDKLATAGAELIVRALPLLEAGQLIPEKQDDSKSCYAKMLSKTIGLIDWETNASAIERKVRGLNSWPSAYTLSHGKNIKIWKAEVMPEQENAVPGRIRTVEKDALVVETGCGDLRITEVQLEGKKRMSVQDFLRGNRMETGDILGV